MADNTLNDLDDDLRAFVSGADPEINPIERARELDISADATRTKKEVDLERFTADIEDKQQELPKGTTLTSDGQTVFDGSAPESAIADSPVSTLFDRIPMQFGNTKGNIARLKRKFNDVKMVEGLGLVVQKGDKWFQVDPGTLDPNADAWQITEALKDTVEFAVTAIAPVVLETLGTAAGSFVGPVGSVAGFGAGAVAGATVNQSLGRLFDTYQATPEETRNDLMWETVFNLGGYGIFQLGGKAAKIPAVRKAVREQFEKVSKKPIVSAALNALKNIKDFASGSTKEVTKNIIGATGIGDEAAAQLIKDPVGINGRMSKFMFTDGGLKLTVKDTQDKMAQQNIGDMKKFLSDTPKFLSNGFQKRKRDVLKSPKLRNVSINHGEVVDDMMKEMVPSNIVKAELKPDGSILKWSVPSPEKLDTLLRAGGEFDIPLLRDQAVKQISKVVNSANKLRLIKGKQGRDGLNQAMQLRSEIGNMYMESTKANPALKSIMRQPTTGARKKLDELFGINLDGSVRPGMEDVATKFRGMNKFYADNVDSVVDAKRISSFDRAGTGESRVESFVDGVFSGPKQNQTILFNRMESIADDSGKQLATNIRNTDAGKQLIKKMPHFKASPGSKATIANVARLALTATGITSPRLQARTAGALVLGRGGNIAWAGCESPYD